MKIDMEGFDARLTAFELDKTLRELRQEKSNGYVKRWIVRGGTIIVTETSQPNLWLSRLAYDSFPGLKSLSAAVELKTDAHRVD